MVDDRLGHVVVRRGEVDGLLALLGDRELVDVEVPVLRRRLEDAVEPDPRPGDLVRGVAQLLGDRRGDRALEALAVLRVVVDEPRLVDRLVGGDGQLAGREGLQALLGAGVCGLAGRLGADAADWRRPASPSSSGAQAVASATASRAAAHERVAERFTTTPGTLGAASRIVRARCCLRRDLRLPVVAGAGLAGQRSRQVDVGAGPEAEHQDAVVLVGRADRGSPRRTYVGPRQRSQPRCS